VLVIVFVYQTIMCYLKNGCLKLKYFLL